MHISGRSFRGGRLWLFLGFGLAAIISSRDAAVLGQTPDVGVMRGIGSEQAPRAPSATEYGVDIYRGRESDDPLDAGPADTEDDAVPETLPAKRGIVFNLDIEGPSGKTYFGRCRYIDVDGRDVRFKLDGVTPDFVVVEGLAINCIVTPQPIVGGGYTIELWADDNLIAEQRLGSSDPTGLVRSDGPWGQAQACSSAVVGVPEPGTKLMLCQ